MPGNYPGGHTHARLLAARSPKDFTLLVFFSSSFRKKKREIDCKRVKAQPFLSLALGGKESSPFLKALFLSETYTQARHSGSVGRV